MSRLSVLMAVLVILMVPAGAPAEDSAAPVSAPEKPEDGFVPPPNALVEPIQSLGIGASTTEQTNVGTVAVQGLFEALYGADSVAGYLGVNIPDTTTDDFVSPYLKALSDDEIGVLGFSANSSDDNFGVVGVGGESAWGGRFINSDATGGVRNQVDLAGPDAAGYFRGADNTVPDIVLGAGGGENGTLWSDPDWLHSDILMYSMDEFWVYLDANNDSVSEFRVYNGAGAVVHRITEAGTKSAVLQTENYGQRAVYSIESPEVWLEDFGSGSLLEGVAEVVLEPIFAETVNRNLDYHVFLTPVCREPVLLFVTAKTPSGFGVRGVGLEGRPARCDFDYRITAKRLGVEDIRLEEVTDELPGRVAAASHRGVEESTDSGGG